MTQSKPPKIEAEKLLGMDVSPPRTTFSEKDSILYALGIGFNKDPLKQQDFKYTNQFNQQFIPFPTIGVTILGEGFGRHLVKSPHFPQFNPHHILHAQHKFTMVKDKIEIGVEYEHEGKIDDCVDKGKNAFIYSKCNTYCRNEKQQRQLCFINQTTIFLRGLGGFKFQGKGMIQPPVQVPKRKPDYKLVGETEPGQAFIYRLCADLNPLHIDPKIAKAFKFERPIIHGLATYGTVARVFTETILKNDPTRLKAIQTRFVGHVFPGESLDISVWKEGEVFIYDAIVKERGTRAIVGYIEVRSAAKL